jgi:hypothetical protein
MWARARWGARRRSFRRPPAAPQARGPPRALSRPPWPWLPGPVAARAKGTGRGDWPEQPTRTQRKQSHMHAFRAPLRLRASARAHPCTLGGRRRVALRRVPAGLRRRRGSHICPPSAPLHRSPALRVLSRGQPWLSRRPRPQAGRTLITGNTQPLSSFTGRRWARYGCGEGAGQGANRRAVQGPGCSSPWG